ncbi:hypothetical protein SAMD00024442_15_46 [Candidatus Symbiothrix dinenymphae]|nr:hypothetical protein SAMD00024442_15_46 [Candidatus Symbiothrix dinenymphae]
MKNMNEIVKFNQVEDKVLNLRGESVILDSDVAVLYGVQTKEINQAVKNNPDKFPESYLWDVSSEEKIELVKIFDRFNPLKHSSVLPTAFTEKGLYMLATILKSPTATQTTIEIIETFAKLKELSRTIAECSQLPDEQARKSRLNRSGEILSDLIGNELGTTETETTLEVNLAVLAFRHTVKREGKRSKNKKIYEEL